jgi:hypothetical protein
MGSRMTYPETNTDGDDLAELKRHQQLLRVIGDRPAHDLLPSHTIWALSRDRWWRRVKMSAQIPVTAWIRPSVMALTKVS